MFNLATLGVQLHTDTGSNDIVSRCTWTRSIAEYIYKCFSCFFFWLLSLSLFFWLFLFSTFWLSCVAESLFVELLLRGNYSSLSIVCFSLCVQVQNPHNIKYCGTVQGLQYIWKTEGFRGLFKGNGTNCARIVPNSAVKFFSYEQASKYSLLGLLFILLCLSDEILLVLYSFLKKLAHFGTWDFLS